jgi:hypothetical protein
MEMKRVSSVVKFSFHVHELVLILRIHYKFSMKSLFVTEGCDKVSTGVLENQFIFS